MTFFCFARTKRTATLTVLILLQALAAVFFVADAITDILTEELDWHVAVEVIVAIALGVGIVFGALEIRRSIKQLHRSEEVLFAVRGAFFELINNHFEQWKLTPAEREVAFLAIKGFDIAEIARLRNAAPGTVRAQLSNVYRKSGVTNRTELLSVFIDELLVEDFTGTER